MNSAGFSVSLVAAYDFEEFALGTCIGMMGCKHVSEGFFDGFL